MCTSYTSGLCGVQQPERDLGSMLSARIMPPDIEEVLNRRAPLGGDGDPAVGEDPERGGEDRPTQALEKPVLHYGVPFGDAFLKAFCGAELGYYAPKAGEVECPDCLAKVRETISQPPAADLHTLIK